jgi:hypothetical protein
VRERIGRNGLNELIARSGSHCREVLSSPIRKLAWYPYKAYVEMLEAIDRKLGRGDTHYGRELGSAAGDRDLGTIFRIYVALASPERLIRSCTRVWEGYYRNAGRMVAEAWEPDHTQLRIYDFPQMAPIHCRLLEGWMIKTMATIGFQVLPGASETACCTSGGDFHEFTAQWTKKA